VVEVTIWILLKTAVSANIVPAQPEELFEMFERIKKGERVYDAFGRDVSAEVVEEIIALHEYDAMKIRMENRVCEFFDKLKKAREARPEDIVLAVAIARLYGLNVDKYTVLKTIWRKDPSLIPTPPRCLSK
jgi:hypothetical protein